MEEQGVAKPAPGSGPQYYVNLEGREVPWPEPTITTEDVAALGGWDVAQGVIEIDRDNNERTLAAGDRIDLKPGHGFAKKIRFKRGTLYDERIAAEVGLLRGVYPELQFEPGGRWVLLPAYSLPEGWSVTAVDVAFQISTSHPGTPPYGVYAPSGLQFKGGAPANYSDPAATQPPFPGRWAIFSWTPDDGQWVPLEDPRKGANLVNWAVGIAQRFRQGV